MHLYVYAMRPMAADRTVQDSRAPLMRSSRYEYVHSQVQVPKGVYCV